MEKLVMWWLATNLLSVSGIRSHSPSFAPFRQSIVQRKMQRPAEADGSDGVMEVRNIRCGASTWK
jgi:hypothetical protein